MTRLGGAAPTYGAARADGIWQRVVGAKPVGGNAFLECCNLRGTGSDDVPIGPVSVRCRQEQARAKVTARRSRE